MTYARDACIILSMGERLASPVFQEVKEMKCHECGKDAPDAFGRRVDGSPSMEGFSGYDAGEKNNQGEIWQVS